MDDPRERVGFGVGFGGCGGFLLLGALGAAIVVLRGWPSALAVLGVILPVAYILTSFALTSMRGQPPSALGGLLGMIWFASFFATIGLFLVVLLLELLG